MGVVQLDSVNVMARSHYLPFFSRLGPYDRASLDRWLWRSGELFEYLVHEASLAPIDRRPALVHRMAAVHPWRSVRELAEKHPGFVEQVLDEVRAKGPLTVGDLAGGAGRTGPWWGWGPGKRSLEWLFAKGVLSIADRPNFTKLYDLTERVIPPDVLGRDPLSEREGRKLLLRDAARHHGVGVVADLADYHRIKVSDARPLLVELAASGDIEEVEVDGWPAPVYADPDLAVPRTVDGAVLLSPFDPVVWFRDRAERLFGFRYRIEIYVPAPKRVHGYYVLPFLLDGRLVGRVDLKSDRARGRLLVQGAFAEQGVDRRRVAAALDEVLMEVAAWQGLGAIEVRRRGDLAPLLSP